MPQSNGNSSPLSVDIHLLGDLLGTVIREQHGDAALNTVEQVRSLAKARRDTDADAHESLAHTVCDLDLSTRRIR